MTIKGTVTHILPTQSGMGSKGEWHKSGFVIETEGQHPKAIAFVCWGLSIMNEVHIGGVVEVEFSVESREYQGRWYTDARASKVMELSKPKTFTQSKPKPQPEVRNEMVWPDETPGEMLSKIQSKEDKPQADEEDNLPF